MGIRATNLDQRCSLFGQPIPRVNPESAAKLVHHSLYDRWLPSVVPRALCHVKVRRVVFVFEPSQFHPASGVQWVGVRACSISFPLIIRRLLTSSGNG